MLGKCAEWRWPPNLEALGELLQYDLSVAQKCAQAEVAEPVAASDITTLSAALTALTATPTVPA